MRDFQSEPATSFFDDAALVARNPLTKHLVELQRQLDGLAVTYAGLTPAARRGLSNHLHLREAASSAAIDGRELAWLSIARADLGDAIGSVPHLTPALALLRLLRRADRYRLRDIFSPRAAVLLRLRWRGRPLDDPFFRPDSALASHFTQLLSADTFDTRIQDHPYVAAIHLMRGLGREGEYHGSLLRALAGAWLRAFMPTSTGAPLGRSQKLGAAALPPIVMSRGFLGRMRPSWQPGDGVFLHQAGSAMVAAAADTAEMAIAFARQADALVGGLSELDRRTNAGALADELLRRPLISSANLAEGLQVDVSSARRILARLERRRLIREVTGRESFRLWEVCAS